MPKFWQFQAAAAGDSADLLLYGPISSESWWGDEVTPKQFAEDLKALGDIKTLNLFINSDGGDVFAGQAILSMLKRHTAQKVVYIDGLAASIASVIAMAGDRIIMPKNAMMMIHKPWTVAVGNADDFRRMADDLDKIGESIVAAYAERTGLKNEEILQIMAEETWFTAEEAVEWGFATEIEEAKKVAASVQDKILTVNGQKFDLKKWKNAPKILEIEPEKPAEEPEKAPDGVEQDEKALLSSYIALAEAQKSFK